MIESPLVSVLTTAYNREKYIAEAIESVLASTYTNFELIVVDDCSTDKTVEIAKSYEAKDDRVKVYVNEKNLGDYPNRNRAASYAKGKYIKYLDSDDILYYYALDVMVKSMESFPNAGWGLSAVGEEYRYYPVCILPRDIYIESFAKFHHFDRAPGSAIIKRAVFLESGGFTGERMIGDYDLWLRFAMKYPMVKMQRDLYWDRTHEFQERQSEYAKQYDKLRNEVFRRALKAPSCPLSKEEIKMIIRLREKKKMKHRILELLQFKNFR